MLNNKGWENGKQKCDKDCPSRTLLSLRSSPKTKIFPKKIKNYFFYRSRQGSVKFKIKHKEYTVSLVEECVPEIQV